MFAHLHTHTEYSELDGLSKVPALADRARRLGQEALAITDHGNLYGAIAFYRACQRREHSAGVGDGDLCRAGQPAGQVGRARGGVELVPPGLAGAERGGLAQPDSALDAGAPGGVSTTGRGWIASCWRRTRRESSSCRAVRRRSCSGRCSAMIWPRRGAWWTGTARCSTTATTSRFSVTRRCRSLSRR